MKRIEKIKERLFNREYVTRKSWWGEGETILVNEEVKSEPLIVRKSLAVLHVARNMPIEVKDDELIVGVPTMASVGFGMLYPRKRKRRPNHLIRRNPFLDIIRQITKSF
jgi:hypothetical protein